MIKNFLSTMLIGMLALGMAVPVQAAEIDTTIYETLKAPDYDELQLEIEDTSISYTMDVCDDRVYIIGEGLTVEHEKKESPVVLIYDEGNKNWSSIWATFIDSDGELDIIAGDDVLYFFDNHYSSLTIYGYDLKTKEVKELSKFNWDTEKRAPELSYDGEYIWMYGGEYRDAETGAWMMLSGVSRWNISTGKLEDVDVSKEEKEQLFEEITNQKEEKAQMLTKAKEALNIYGEAEIAGALNEDYFYIFGDAQTDGQMNQIFCRFSMSDEPEINEQEETVEMIPDEESSEELDETEEDVDLEEKTDAGEDGVMKLIAVVCALVAAGSVVGFVRGKLAKKSKKEKGEEE